MEARPESMATEQLFKDGAHFGPLGYNLEVGSFRIPE
jgi:hypothetical protein